MKQRLYMVGVNGRYGENVYPPFAVGCIWSYARTFPEITDAYEMCGFLYLKEPISTAISRLEAPDLIGLSCYIWNWEWSKAFAQAVKAKWPTCKIVVGGVQIQDESPKTLAEHPYFDFAIYGEGEGAFADFLKAHTLADNRAATSYINVGSLIYRTYNGIVVNPRRAFTDLAELRSPYLDGVFDELWPREPRWQVLVEYDRGCGVGCHFCAWGQASQNKLRLFPEDRIRAELEWFGQHKVPYIDQCDANFAVVKRDVELTRVLVKVKEKYGYPQTFRTSFAKNSNDTVWDVANILHDAGMLKSVSLAMQSMDDNVLIAIHRKNIKYEKFGELIRRYEAAGIPTYTELILGLPQESLDTFLDGIEKNLDAGQHSGLFIYLNLRLENTEQNKPEYMKMHGLRSLPMQAMLTHGTPNNSEIREIQEIIVESSAMPHADWKKAYLFAKIIEIFHAQGLLQEIAIALHKRGVRYRDFYSRLQDWLILHPTTVAGREYYRLVRLLDGVLAGGSWDLVDPKFGDISWPPEEFAFANICCEAATFYNEIWPFLKEQGVTAESAAAQAHLTQTPAPGREAEFAREVVWFGRKGSAAVKRTARAGGKVMKAAMIGCGKLGYPVSLAWAKFHDMVGYDVSPAAKTIEVSRKYPHLEPGAQKILDEGTTFRIVDSVSRAVEHADIVFVSVQTPHGPEYEGITRMPETRADFDYKALRTAIVEVATAAKAHKKHITLVIISTVLPGTSARELVPLVKDNEFVSYVYAPMFIAQGTVVEDTLNPEFCLLGIDKSDARGVEEAKTFYGQMHATEKLRFMSVASAELTKVAYNVALSIKISIANNLMEIAHRVGADCDEVTDALAKATDRVISPKYLRGGMPDAGPCHPRDIIALSWLSQELRTSHDFFGWMVRGREAQAAFIAQIAQEIAGELPIVVLGKAYKKGTNLVIGSSAILLKNIIEEQKPCEQWDPRIDPPRAFTEPAVFVVATDHDEFYSLSFMASLPEGSTVIDPWGKMHDIDGCKVVRVGRN